MNEPSHLPIPRSLGILFLAAVLSLAALGCQESVAPGPRTEFRDSAGITIAESTHLPERGAGGWALAQLPDVSVGTLDGDTLFQLYQVSGGTLLPGGGMVIFDNGNLRLRVFGPRGEALGSMGREGEGPGEFRWGRLLGVLGSDTLLTVDGRLGRIVRYHLEEGFLDQLQMPEEAGMAYFANGFFSDGSVVFGGGPVFGPGGELPSEGYQRGRSLYRTVDPAGRAGDLLGEIPGREVHVQLHPGEGGGEGFVSLVRVNFGKTPLAHAREDRLALGAGDSYEIRLVTPRGETERIVRVRAEVVPVTSAHLALLLEERLDALEDPAEAPEVRRSFQATPHAQNLPAFQRLILDPEGCLWVEDFLLPDQGLRSWTVFDGEGRPLTRLSLPRGNQVLDIGRDHLLALYRDDLGVEYLRRFPLTRGR